MVKNISTTMVKTSQQQWQKTSQQQWQTSQELPMLSSVTINFQVTKVVMKPGSVLNCQYCNQCLKYHKLQVERITLQCCEGSDC